MTQRKSSKMKVVPASHAIGRRKDDRNMRIRFPGKTGKVGRPRRVPDLIGAF